MKLSTSFLLLRQVKMQAMPPKLSQPAAIQQTSIKIRFIFNAKYSIHCLNECNYYLSYVYYTKTTYSPLGE